LRDFASAYDRQQLLHAELDQMLFRIDKLMVNLRATEKRGAFLPFHTREKGIASIIYFSDTSLITSLLDFVESKLFFRNEMELLAQWAEQNTKEVWALPTPVVYKNEEFASVIKPLNLVSYQELGGFVDAAQIGQWIAGIDPRNVAWGNKPQNKFADTTHPLLLSQEQLAKTDFVLTFDKDLMISLGDAKEFSIYNLHIHSKVHNWFWKNRDRMSEFFRKLSFEEQLSFPGTRRVQLTEIVQSRFWYLVNNPDKLLKKVRSHTFRMFKYRPSTYPIISNDSFANNCKMVFRNTSSISVRTRGRLSRSLYLEYQSLNHFLSYGKSIHPEIDSIILGGPHGNSCAARFSELVATCNRKIYAISPCIEMDGVSILPMGIESRNNGESAKVFSLEKLKSGFKKQYEIVTFLDVFSEQYNVVELYEKFSVKSHVKVFSDISTRKKRQILQEFAFRLFPEGGIRDCPAIWESIYLGCIPVVKRNYFMDSLEKNGIPIWVVDDFEEATKITEKELADKYAQFHNALTGSVIELDYWFSQVNQGAN
jgi:hypothetical protein